MKIVKSPVPVASETLKFLPADYSDVFCCNIETEKEVAPDDIMVNFWIERPKWVEALFKLRNILVKPFKLSTGKEENVSELENCIRTGTDYKGVSVVAKTPNETLLLLKDKHLDAYISVFIEDEQANKSICLITVVKFNNNLGKLYFFAIRPFHKIVVKGMLKKTVKLNL